MLGLPGDNQMRDEIWKRRARILDETCCYLPLSFLEFVFIWRDEYRNTLSIAPCPVRSVSVEYERDKEASAVFGSDDIESRRDWAHGDFYESDVVFLSEMVDRR